MNKVKFGLVPPMPGADCQGLVDFSIKADNMGFDSLWFPDHLAFIAPSPAYEAWTIAAAVAQQTKNILIGTTSDPHRNHPAVFAQRLATVDHLSKGRVALGLGVGESMNTDAYGIPWDNPFKRMTESMDIMKLLWSTNETVSYNGDFFKLKDASLLLNLYDDRKSVPFYFATHTDKGLDLIGRSGDGWMPLDLTPGLYKESLDKIKKSALNSGRDMKDIDTTLWIFTSLGDNEDEAYKTLEPFRYVCIMQDQLKKAGYDIEIPDEYKGLNYFNITPTDETRKQKFRDLGKFFPREAVIDFTITGSKKDCIKKIEKYVDKGVKHFVLFHYFSPDPVRAMEVYSKEIIPYFNS